MADFNQRGQKVDKQYNAENINFNNEGEHSSDSQKTYLINCLSCGQLVEVACPYIDKAPKSMIVNYYNTNVIKIPGNTYLVCPHCKANMQVQWIR